MNPALASAGAALLPREIETLLLRACLDPGPRGREAWDAFVARVGSPVPLFREDRHGLRRLGPLLYTALREAGVEPDPDIAARLRMAYMREELRAEEFRAITAEVLIQLTERGIEVAVLKGAALGETVYDNPVLRHSHDLELLVLTDGLARQAARALEDDGLTPDPGAARIAGGPVLVHPSGLPVVVRSRLFPSAHFPLTTEAVWGHREEAAIAGVGSSVLAPEDALLNALGAASSRRTRGSLQWACDASLLTRGRADLDWERFRSSARAARMRIPAAVLLRYLAEELPSGVPSAVLADLEAEAALAPSAERDAFLFGVRSTLDGGMSELLRRVDSWRERLLILRWTLFPSKGYLSAAHGQDGLAALAVVYLKRPFAYAADRLRWRLAARRSDAAQR